MHSFKFTLGIGMDYSRNSNTQGKKLRGKARYRGDCWSSSDMMVVLVQEQYEVRLNEQDGGLDSVRIPGRDL